MSPLPLKVAGINSPPFAIEIKMLHNNLNVLSHGVFFCLHHCAVVCYKSKMQQKFSSSVKHNLVPVLLAMAHYNKSTNHTQFKQSHDPTEKCIMATEHITET